MNQCIDHLLVVSVHMIENFHHNACFPRCWLAWSTPDFILFTVLEPEQVEPVQHWGVVFSEILFLTVRLVCDSSAKILPTSDASSLRPDVSYVVFTSCAS